MFRRILILITIITAVGFTGTSCSTSAGQKVNRAAADLLLPPSQEEQLGDQMAAELEGQLQFVQDPVVNQYVDELGQKAVRAAGDVPEGIDFDFHVVEDDSQINAFATPGGHIYVYSGLLMAADNEAELMSVLSHEVAHVTRRHIAQSLTAQYGIQTLASIALGQNPGMLAQIVANVGASGYLMKYGRDKERDADKYGIVYLIRSGYDPYAFVSFFEELEKQDAGGVPTFLRSHPSPGERIANARQMIERGGQNLPNATNADRYQNMVARLN